MFLCRITKALITLVLGLTLNSCSTTHYGSGPVGPFMRNPRHGCLLCQHHYSGAPQHPDRKYSDFVIDAGCAGRAHVTVSLPKDIPSTGLPVLMILSGLEAGAKSLQYIPNHGNYALIAYEYPEALQKVEGLSTLFKSACIKNAVNSVPGQVLVVSEWARQQSWSNGKPLSLIGVSFGGFFIPAIHHLAQAQCHDLGPGVIAYSGACLYHIVYCNLDTFAPLKGISALFGTALINQLEPAAHLPCLEGEFLIVEGSRDEQMPWHSRERLKCLTPNPKTIVTLDTCHITAERPELTRALYNIIQDWLSERWDD